MIKGTRVLSRQMVSSRIDNSNTDLKSVSKSFYNTMKSMMTDYTDTSKDMVVNGVSIKAKDKYGLAGTLMIGQFMTDTTKAIESVMNFKTTLFSLEKKLTAARS
ncbi:MAG: hypothetical protein HQ564_06705 [Candidatus Saganbacteria bacterium]|nr:hypothetical protein [Candidatus Saganbacteria bacterium]